MRQLRYHCSAVIVLMRCDCFKCTKGFGFAPGYHGHDPEPAYKCIFPHRIGWKCHLIEDVCMHVCSPSRVDLQAMQRLEKGSRAGSVATVADYAMERGCRRKKVSSDAIRSNGLTRMSLPAVSWVPQSFM